MLIPSVTVIIPTYNRGDTLKNAVNSVLQQSFQNFEIIVVDDYSAKPATASLKEAGISDPRIRVIRHEHNQGQAAGRNTGAAHAKGKWLTYLDDDDLFHRLKLSAQLAYMKKHHCRVSVTDFTLPGDQHLYNARNSDQDPAWLILTGRFLALPSTMMIEKKLYHHLGGFDPDPKVRCTEDLDFALRLYKDGQHMAAVPQFLSHYSGFHPATPEFELKALQGVEDKHQHSFHPGSRAHTMFRVTMEWKKSHVELTRRPILPGAIRLASLAFQHPVIFTGPAKSILENPLNRLSPPLDRPKTHLPLDPKLSFPYVPV